MTNLVPVPGVGPVIELENGMLASGGPGGNMNLQAQALLNYCAYLQNAANTLSQQVQAGQMNVYNPTLQASIGGYSLGALVGRTDQSGWWFSQVAANTTNPETFGAGWFPFGSLNGPYSQALSNANVTLTALQAANDILLLTGTLTANVTLTLPAWVGKRWLIINQTTGAFTVTVTTGSGSTVVTSGTSRVLCLSSGLVNELTYNLPTSLPSTAGLLWNNGGVLCLS